MSATGCAGDRHSGGARRRHLAASDLRCRRGDRRLPGLAAARAAGGPRMSTIGPPRSWLLAAVDALCIAGLVIAGSLALGAAYGGERWLVACAGGAVVGSVIALVAGRFRWHWGVTGFALVMGYLVFGAALALPSTTIGGLLPSV